MWPLSSTHSYLTGSRQRGRGAYDSLIGLLDHSPEPDFWDDFFLPRCKLLTTAEIEAVAAWVCWLQATVFNSHGRTFLPRGLRYPLLSAGFQGAALTP